MHLAVTFTDVSIFSRLSHEILQASNAAAEAKLKSAENAQLKSEIVKLNSSAALQKSEIVKLNAEVVKSLTEQKAAAAEFEKLKMNLTQLQQKFAALQDASAKKDMTNNYVQKQKEDADKEALSKNTENTKLKGELEKQRGVLVKCETELKAACAEVEKQKKNVNAILKQKEDADKQISQLKQSAATSDNEIKELTRRLKEAVSRATEAEQQGAKSLGEVQAKIQKDLSNARSGELMIGHKSGAVYINLILLHMKERS